MLDQPWSMEHFKFRSPVPLRSQRTATACFSTLRCFPADLHLKRDDTPNAIERTKSAQEIFNAKDGRKGPKRSRRRINFPKVCRWRLKAQTLKLHERASFGRVRCLRDRDTKGEPMAGISCHHVRKSGAEPAAHAIRVISAGGCSLPCRHLGSELTYAGGKPAPRPDLADDTTLWAPRLSNWQPTRLSANKLTPPRLRE